MAASETYTTQQKTDTGDQRQANMLATATGTAATAQKDTKPFTNTDMRMQNAHDRTCNIERLRGLMVKAPPLESGCINPLKWPNRGKCGFDPRRG